MQEPRLLPRPLYGIGTVARLTGVKPDTLRIWERRYSLGASHKSLTGRRQYTQADLEHLQLVAALLACGARIGEIAAAERKTLEMLLCTRPEGDRAMLPEPKPRVLFVGEELCTWLEQHSGCLVNVDAFLAPVSPGEISGELLSGVDEVHTLVVAVTRLSRAQLGTLDALRSAIRPKRVMLIHQHATAECLKALQEQHIIAMQFPPDPARLGCHLANCAADKLGQSGQLNIGELVPARPRVFSDGEISAATALQKSTEPGCPRQLTDLVAALARYEEYTANCSVENWEDAAIHSCIYAYAGQARWLMEKALGVVLGNLSVDSAVEEVNRDSMLRDRR